MSDYEFVRLREGNELKAMEEDVGKKEEENGEIKWNPEIIIKSVKNKTLKKTQTKARMETN